MKEYVKYFGSTAAIPENGYEIKDIPFITSVDGDPIQNLHCNESNRRLVVENGIVKVVNRITITGTWDPSLTDNETEVTISGNVNLYGKTDCYSLTFLSEAHLTINEGARLRVWKGGITNDNCSTVNYLTLKQNNIQETYSEFLIHPSVTVNNHPKATVSIVLETYTKSSSDYLYDAICVPTIDVIDSISITKDEQNVQAFVRIYENNRWTSLGYLNVPGQSFRKDRMNQPFWHYAVQANTPEIGSIVVITGNLYGNINKTLQVVGTTAKYCPFENSYSANFKTAKLFDFLDEPKRVMWGWNVIPDSDSTNIEVNESNLSQYPNVTPFSCPFMIDLNNTIKTFTIDYKTWIWDPSFDEITPTRYTKGVVTSKPVEIDTSIFDYNIFNTLDNSFETSLDVASEK